MWKSLRMNFLHRRKYRKSTLLNPKTSFSCKSKEIIFVLKHSTCVFDEGKDFHVAILSGNCRQVLINDCILPPLNLLKISVLNSKCKSTTALLTIIPIFELPRKDGRIISAVYKVPDIIDKIKSLYLLFALPSEAGFCALGKRICC